MLAAGIADPARHVVVYRSAWNVRILLQGRPWTPEQIATVRKFCDDRSFDVSYYPGFDATAARADIYNDLPPIDFESGEVESSGSAQDAVADEASLVLSGQTSPSQRSFDLRPITLDRPFYYAILRLDHLPQILSRLEILPQQEVGQLVNVAVLAQSAVLALLVLAVPLFAPRVAGGADGRVPVGRAIVYFACLGLGFLCIEIFLIEKASFYLNDRTSAFALVLTGMLVFSGFGSLLANRIPGGIVTAAAIIVGWCMLALVGLEPLVAPHGRPALGVARRDPARSDGPGFIGFGSAVPDGPRACWLGGDAALGLGVEWRFFRRRHAASPICWPCMTDSTAF